VKIIVQWKNSAVPARNFKILSRGGAVFSSLNSIKDGIYSLSPVAVKDLASDPDVVHISLDHSLHAKLDNTAGAINASAVWANGAVGTGIGVAVIDSGMNGDQDLSLAAGIGTRIVYVEDFVNPILNPITSGKALGALNRPNQYGQDLYGHGQHIAGIIGGNGFSSNCSNCTRNFIGAAPGVSLLDLRVLDGNGEGSDSTVITAINRAIQLQSI